MNTHEQIKQENKFINSLIKKGRDNFDIGLAIELKQLTERIKHKRSVSSKAARKIARELLQHEVKAIRNQGGRSEIRGAAQPR